MGYASRNWIERGSWFMIQVCKKRSKVAEIIVSCVCVGGGGILYIVEITDMSQFSQQPSKSCLELIRAVVWTL